MEPNIEDEIQFVARPTDVLDLVFNLAGAILAEKSPHRNGVLNSFKNAWGTIGDGDYQIVPVDDRVYSIMVRDEVLATHILESGPWNVDNRLFNVIPWSRDLAIEEVDFSGIKFWIQIHNVPLGVMTEGTARNIARKVGEVLDVEDPIKLSRTFLRVRVKIDGRKLLYSGFYEPKSGPNRRRISIKYERLREYCYRCGRIGHTLQFCQWDDGPSELENFYGPELCVSTARKLNFDNSSSDNHRSSSFWDGFGGGRGKQSCGANGPSVARVISDSEMALQLDRSRGPCQHGFQLVDHVASVTVENLGLDSGPNTDNNTGLSHCSSPTQPVLSTVTSEILSTPPIQSNTTISLLNVSLDDVSEVEKYRSPILLSDASDNDMDTSEKPLYHVTEISDKEDNNGALVPVVKMISPIVSDVSLATVFDRLKLKRPCDSVIPESCQKLQKAEVVGSIVRRPLCPIVNTELSSYRTRSQKNKAARGRGRGKQVSKPLPTTLSNFNDENLCDVSICQDDSLHILSIGKGCGGGPNTATRYP